jgi:hypothetical protein
MKRRVMEVIRRGKRVRLIPAGIRHTARGKNLDRSEQGVKWLSRISDKFPAIHVTPSSIAPARFRRGSV